MKITIDEKPAKPAPEYPRLMMTERGNIVWFFKPKHGMTVKNDNYGEGYYSDNWSMDLFTPFNGSVTMSND